MIKRLRLTAVAAPGVVFGLGFLLARHPLVALAVLLVAGGWLLTAWRIPGGSPAVDSFGLLVFSGIAAWGSYVGLSTWIALLGLVLSLAAWDLMHFARRQSEALDEASAARMAHTHLTRLGFALGGGLVLGSLALAVRVPLDFVVALAIGALAVAALSRLVVAINR
jgi:hypothetical protein